MRWRGRRRSSNIEDRRGASAGPKLLGGVWALRADKASNILESGDVEEALNAASAIGDDTLQRQSTGTVVPESFTHGTAAQRQRWSRTGLGSGDPDTCDTFSVDRI